MCDFNALLQYKSPNELHDSLTVLFGPPVQEEKVKDLLGVALDFLSKERPGIKELFHKAAWMKGKQPNEMQESLDLKLQLLNRSSYVLGLIMPKIEEDLRFVDVLPAVADMIEKLEQDLEDFCEIPDFV